MDRKQFTASITIFFTLLVLPVMALFLVVLRTASVHVEQNDCIRMTITAGNALLTCYDSDLADRYGLYGADQEMLNRYAGAFLRENEKIPTEEIRQTPAYLLNADSLWTGFFQYAAGDVGLEPEALLSEPKVMLGQIREFMKYRLLEEGYEALFEACEKIKEISAGTGIEGLFSGLQDKLSAYAMKYQELNTCLYPEGGVRPYVTITKKENYSPEKLKAALHRLHDEGKIDFLSDEYHMIEQWNKTAGKLAEINRDAIRILQEMQEVLQEIRLGIQEIKESAAGLSLEEQGSPRIQDILKQLEEIVNGLWGMKGELQEYIRICVSNADSVQRIDEQLSFIMPALQSHAEISETDWKAAMEAADSFAVTYRDDFANPVTGEGKFSIRDLSRIWDWLLDWRVDLKEYGADRSVIPDQEAETVYLAEKDELMEALEELGRESSLWEFSYDKFIIAEYCVGMFRSLEDQILQEDGQIAVNLRKEPFPKGLFRNETEFIIKGTYNEYRNLKAVRFRILAIRLIMNMAFLSTNADRNAKILELAAHTGGILAPGVGTKIAYDMILTLWSAAEAYVDYNLLVQGGRIPLIKTGDTWLTDLDDVLAMNKENLLGKTKKDKGLDYEDYLRILLLFGDRDKELLRVRELIERNLQMDGKIDFSLSEQVVSFRLETEILARTGTYRTNEVFSYE